MPMGSRKYSVFKLTAFTSQPSNTSLACPPSFTVTLHRQEMCIRDSVGVVTASERNAQGKQVPVTREIDFIATSGGKKVYLQSAYALGSEEKALAENRPFSLTGDSFPKIIVRHDIRKRWYDEQGVLNIGILDFLLDEGIV